MEEQQGGSPRPEQEKDEGEHQYMMMGVALGMCLGVALGMLVFDSLALIGIGMCLGLAVGAALDARKARKGKGEAAGEDKSAEE